MQKKSLQQLFDKDMTRREFLAHIGTALLVLVGIKGLMNHFLGETNSSNSASAYGTSRYGR